MLGRCDGALLLDAVTVGGYFRGTEEDVLVIKIATSEEEKVWKLAHVLRRELHQDGVGIEVDGAYSRATEERSGSLHPS